MPPARRTVVKTHMDGLERHPPEAQVPAGDPVPVEVFAAREERETLPDGRRIIYYSRAPT